MIEYPTRSSRSGRLMSVALTTDQVRDRSKTVTRRLNWWADKNDRRILRVGDRLQLCKKVQGRRPGEPLERLADVLVVDLSRQQLRIRNTPDEAAREGFPHLSWPEFVEFFCSTHKGATPSTVITRIEWRYLDPALEA